MHTCTHTYTRVDVSCGFITAVLGAAPAALCVVPPRQSLFEDESVWEVQSDYQSLKPAPSKSLDAAVAPRVDLDTATLATKGKGRPTQVTVGAGSPGVNHTAGLGTLCGHRVAGLCVATVSRVCVDGCASRVLFRVRCVCWGCAHVCACACGWMLLVSLVVDMSTWALVCCVRVGVRA